MRIFTTVGVLLIFGFAGPCGWAQCQLQEFSLPIAGGLGDETPSAASGTDCFLGRPESGAGTVLHLEKVSGQWVRNPDISGPSLPANARFGSALATDGSTLVVGAATESFPVGAAYVFSKNPMTGAWDFVQRLTPSDGVGGNFGTAVAIQGSWIFVGAPFHGFGGAVYVYRFDMATWSETQKLPGNTPDGTFGRALALDADLAVVGAPNRVSSSPGNGTCVAYREIQGVWNQLQTLAPSRGLPENDYGWEVTLQGSRLLVGAPFEVIHPEPPVVVGAVYSYEFNGASWEEQQRITLDLHTQLFDSFGTDLTLDGDLLVAGLPHRNDSIFNVGGIALLRRTAGVWEESANLRPTISNGLGPSAVGLFVELLGPELLFGVNGSVFVFENVEECLPFLRGDCNTSGAIDIADPLFGLNYLFGSGASPRCEDACDSDGNGVLDVGDSIALLTYLFNSAPAPFVFFRCEADFGSTDPLSCAFFAWSDCP